MGFFKREPSMWDRMHDSIRREADALKAEERRLAAQPKTCGYCKHSQGFGHGDDVLLCRRFPPTIPASGTGILWSYPRVSAYGTCAEHSPFSEAESVQRYGETKG